MQNKAARQETLESFDKHCRAIKPFFLCLSITSLSQPNSIKHMVSMRVCLQAVGRC